VAGKNVPCHTDDGDGKCIAKIRFGREFSQGGSEGGAASPKASFEVSSDRRRVFEQKSCRFFVSRLFDNRIGEMRLRRNDYVIAIQWCRVEIRRN